MSIEVNSTHLIWSSDCKVLFGRFPVYLCGCPVDVRDEPPLSVGSTITGVHEQLMAVHITVQTLVADWVIHLLRILKARKEKTKF